MSARICVAGIVVLGMLIACSKNVEFTDPPITSTQKDEIPIRTTDVLKTETIRLLMNTGTMHNSILSAVMNEMNANPLLQNLNYLANRTNFYLVNQYGFEPQTASKINAEIEDLNRLEANNYYLLQKEKMDSIIASMVSALNRSPLISAQEKVFLNQLTSIFNIPDYVSEIEAYDLIYSRADKLIAQWVITTWPAGFFPGEASGGFLYIARESAKYWKNQAIAGAISEILPPWIRRWGFPQFDAAGYIVGWGKAWLYDEEPKAKKRIGAGLSKAVEWSGLRSATRSKIS